MKNCASILISSCLIFHLSSVSCQKKETGAMTCMAPTKLAALVFGCIFGSVLICSLAAIALWIFFSRRKPEQKILVVSPQRSQIYENKAFDVEDKDKSTSPLNDQCTRFPSYRAASKNAKRTTDRFDKICCSNNKNKQIIQSTESLQNLKDVVKVALCSRDSSGLGLTIHGSMSEGIFVRELMSSGPARDSGVIQAGDRLLNVTVSFENMVFEDALTILSYASPYPVTLELEKPNYEINVVTASIEDNANNGQSEKDGKMVKLHPLFRRSQSIENLWPTRGIKKAQHSIDAPDKTEKARRTISLFEQQKRLSSAFSNCQKEKNCATNLNLTPIAEMLNQNGSVRGGVTGRDYPYIDLSGREKVFDRTGFGLDTAGKEDGFPSPPPPAADIRKLPLTRTEPSTDNHLLAAQHRNAEIDSLPDVGEIRKTFEENREELLNMCPSPPPPASSPPRELSPISLVKTVQIDQSSQLPTSNTQTSTTRLYQEKRHHPLKSLADTKQMNGTAPTINSTNSNAIKCKVTPNDRRMEGNGLLDKDRLTKLMYNQQYLAKEQEDLAKMGIHVLFNSVDSNHINNNNNKNDKNSSISTQSRF